MAFASALQKRLTAQARQLLIRKRNIIETIRGNLILVEGKCCTDFSNNDYLGLKNHPKITAAFIQSIKKYGFGSGASTFVSGYSEAHAETEYLFSKWLKVDKAILFNSGYCANVGIIGALASRSDTIFSDRLCHASLLDGIGLSRAKHCRYQHCDLAHLSRLAEVNPPNLIVTESIFSMEGTLSPIPSLVQHAEHYQSGLLIDDAHGIGVFGKTGAGICEHYGINQTQISCLVLSLGKAFNAMGAIVAGKAETIEAILQFSKTYRYTTALPPAICSTLQTTLNIIQQEAWRREKLLKNIHLFTSYAIDKGLSLTSSDDTPIKPIVIHDNKKVLALQNYLLSKGFYVSAIRPPTVPPNKARLRISLNSLHMQDEIMLLIDHIAAGLKAC